MVWENDNCLHVASLVNNTESKQKCVRPNHYGSAVESGLALWVVTAPLPKSIKGPACCRSTQGGSLLPYPSTADHLLPQLSFDKQLDDFVFAVISKPVSVVDNTLKSVPKNVDESYIDFANQHSKVKPVIKNFPLPNVNLSCTNEHDKLDQVTVELNNHLMQIKRICIQWQPTAYN